MQLCKGGELHTSFEDSSEGKSYTYGDVGRIAVCMLVLADAMHSRGLVHCAAPYHVVFDLTRCSPSVSIIGLLVGSESRLQ